MAEAKLAKNNNLSSLFYECKGYVVATCQRSSWSNKVDDICQVRSHFLLLSCISYEPQIFLKLWDHCMILSCA